MVDATARAATAAPALTVPHTRVFATAFYSALFVLYPRAGDEWLGLVPQFNTMLDALKAQLELALVGKETRIILDSDELLDLSPMRAVDLAAFFSLHFLYVLVSLILLLNLLIAMLSNTFERTQDE